MNDDTHQLQPRSHLTTFATLALILVASAVALSGMGRSWWCQCGQLRLSSWDIWSSHNSQHLMDPYFFSHVLHGILLYAVLRWVPGSISEHTRFAIAMVIESGWEVLENSPIIIDRYRSVTMSLDYYGDTIANSLIDIVACAIGYMFAARVRWWSAAGLFVATELVMLLTIRDSLGLNVLMLIYPLDFIKHWQMP